MSSFVDSRPCPLSELLDVATCRPISLDDDVPVRLVFDVHGVVDSSGGNISSWGALPVCFIAGRSGICGQVSSARVLSDPV